MKIEIMFIGPKRKRIYYVKGQKSFAQRKIQIKESAVMENIFSILENPTFLSEIPDNIKPIIKENPSIFRRIECKLGVGSSRISGTSHDVFGSLAGKTIISLQNDNEKLLKFIAKYIPKPRSTGERRRLTIRLKQCGFKGNEIRRIIMNLSGQKFIS
jgi:hypothetical protein